MIVLRSNAQGRLQIQSALKRLQRQVNSPETCTGCGKSVVDMRGFWLALQGPFKHFLCGHVFSTIELYHPTIIEGVSIARQHVLGAQPRVGDGEIGTRARCYF
jgi:hypothetical protein